MLRKAEQKFTVIVDSREQLPYNFRDAVVKGLRAGDYSILGFEDRVAVERKTLADAYTSLGRHRARFEKELELLSMMSYAAVIIEATLEDFLKGAPYSQLNPKAAVNSLIAWSVRFRLPIFFAGNRRYAKSLTYRLLEKFVRYEEGQGGG